MSILSVIFILEGEKLSVFSSLLSKSFLDCTLGPVQAVLPTTSSRREVVGFVLLIWKKQIAPENCEGSRLQDQRDPLLTEQSLVLDMSHHMFF